MSEQNDISQLLGTYYIDTGAAVLAQQEFDGANMHQLWPAFEYDPTIMDLAYDEIGYLYGLGGSRESIKQLQFTGKFRPNWQWSIPGKFSPTGSNVVPGIAPDVAFLLLYLHNEHAEKLSRFDGIPVHAGDPANPFDDFGVADPGAFMYGALLACRGLRYGDKDTPPPVEDAKYLGVDELMATTREVNDAFVTYIHQDRRNTEYRTFTNIFDELFPPETGVVDTVTTYAHRSSCRGAAYIYALCAFSQEFLDWQSGQPELPEL